MLARIAKTPFDRAVVGTAPFLVPLVLLLITYVPSVTLWLPTLIYR